MRIFLQGEDSGEKVREEVGKDRGEEVEDLEGEEGGGTTLQWSGGVGRRESQLKLMNW